MTEPDTDERNDMEIRKNKLLTLWVSRRGLLYDHIRRDAQRVWQLLEGDRS